MARADKVHRRKKLVREIVDKSSSTGITYSDICARLSGQLGLREIRTALDELKADGLIGAYGTRWFPILKRQ